MEIVDELPSELAKVVRQSGVELDTAESLKTSFAPYFSEVQGWIEKAQSINVTSGDQTREMKLARQTRLALREIRINAEKTRKTLKEDALRKGKAIDGINNMLKYLIEPVEKHLLEQEQFVEREIAARKERLEAERLELLAPYGVDTSVYRLGEMTEETFASLLSGLKAEAERKAEEAMKAEAERIAREEAEAQERERIRQENERLKAEAELQAAAIRAEREAAAEEREAAEAEARRQREAEAEERAKIEARVREEARIAAEKARDELRKAEEKAIAERKAREKIEAERKAIAEAEAVRVAAEKEAARKAAAAPDREKVAAFAVSLRAMPLPALSTENGHKLLHVLAEQVSRFAAWVDKQAESL